MKNKAFTLIELLVVIAIIGIIISILFPILAIVKESSNSLLCQNNLRQLGNSLISYTNYNIGYFPKPSAEAQPEDWVYWQKSRNIQDSRITPYLSGKVLNENVLRCPSDDGSRIRINEQIQLNLEEITKYSYSVNGFICRRYNYFEGIDFYSLKISKIKNSYEKILIIDESKETIDNMMWLPKNYEILGRNTLSIIHDKRKESINNPNIGKGNVFFVDGHVDKITRKDSFLEKSWNPKI